MPQIRQAREPAICTISGATVENCVSRVGFDCAKVTSEIGERGASIEFLLLPITAIFSLSATYTRLRLGGIYFD